METGRKPTNNLIIYSTNNTTASAQAATLLQKSAETAQQLPTTDTNYSQTLATNMTISSGNENIMNLTGDHVSVFADDDKRTFYTASWKTEPLYIPYS